MKKAVFFDRDGVLNELISRDGGFYSPRSVEDFQLVPEAEDVINTIKSEGYLCIAVSNQPDVSRGYLERSELNRMTQILSSTLQVDDVFYCRHDDSDECVCRKPAPGLLFQAKEKWNLGLGHSLMVGDTEKDLEAAERAGVNFFLLDCIYNRSVQTEKRIASLRDIIDFLE
jgi:D-glycero-D-manno-heptose 1,7-bisphosphate phosphatase|tara:strand:- start:335 stop:847 length:513 start_codon:yes stop_codon:yes gene_type:complete